MPLVQRLATKNGFRPLFYCTNDRKAWKKANEILKKRGIDPANAVFEGKGDEDELYRMIGSMQGQVMIAPIYALIDARGVIRHCGNFTIEELTKLVEGF